jgi:hypothetical protein
MIIWSYLGVISVLYVFIIFIRNLGKSVPILELCLLIAGLQWIVGAFIEYRSSFKHFKYFMYVSENTYMSYVVPAYIIFSLTLLINQRRLRKFKLNIEEGKNYSNFGLRIILLSVILQLSSPIIPSQFSFVVYLLVNLKYVGVIILYFSKVKRHNSLIYVLVSLLFLESLISGLFHLFISWLVFFFMFWAYKNKTTIKFNFLVLFCGFILISSIQLVKNDYRSLVWQNYSGNKITLFFDLVLQNLSAGTIENKDTQNGLNSRLNQGWIISALMHHTPTNQPFANGETILAGLYKAIVPRFLDPFNTEIIVRGNFMKYTGLYIAETTSMAMSIAGESYINFGMIGGIIFMGVWGLFLSFIWKQLYLKCLEKPFLIFFLPLIFLQVIKAETELSSALNHLTKTTVFIFVFIWFYNKFLKIPLKNK